MFSSLSVVSLETPANQTFGTFGTWRTCLASVARRTNLSPQSNIAVFTAVPVLSSIPSHGNDDRQGQ